MKVTVDGTEEVSLDVKAGHAHHTHAESPDASFAHEASDSAEDGHSHTHTTYAAVCEEIASLDLPAEVRTMRSPSTACSERQKQKYTTPR